ncbi:UNVERIFIED_CONTAM: hypothetical protein NCL1_33949 [Trichonephila clavipes]
MIEKEILTSRTEKKCKMPHKLKLPTIVLQINA